MTSRVPTLIVHGGAGADPHDGREELREGIGEALRAGWERLSAGGSSLDAVEAAVRALEDHPRFNAGRGSVLTSAETVASTATFGSSTPSSPATARTVSATATRP